MTHTKKQFGLFRLKSPIQVMDVGAAAIAEVPVYKTLLERGLAHLTAFDGDARQVAQMEQAFGPGNVTVLNHFLFDGGQHDLYLCAPESGMTSLFKPRADSLAFFNGFSAFGAVEATQQVQTTRMDDISGLPQIDFLKMDVQGAELGILQNGTARLKDCLMMQLEVSYVPLYEDQPSFGEVDMHMRKAGFLPHRFLDIKRWSIAPTVFNNNIRVPGNQLLESDILYMKDPLTMPRWTMEQVRKFAVLAHYCGQSVDLATFALREMERRGTLKKGAHRSYHENLASFA